MNLHPVQVAMSADFLGAFARLGKQQQKGVRAWIDKFRADPTSKALNYESLKGMRDLHEQTNQEGHADCGELTDEFAEGSTLSLLEMKSLTFSDFEPA